MPPIRRFFTAGVRVGGALVAWRLRERRAGGEASRAGLSLRCRSGMMWVTQEGDPEDHIVSSPGRYETRRPGRVVVVALEPVRFEVLGADVEVRVHPHVRLAGGGGAAAAR